MRKAPNIKPSGLIKPPAPPPPPPCRTYKYCLFAGDVETKESVQRRHDYEIFMKGYSFALRR
jgi:hypothetical protein